MKQILLLSSRIPHVQSFERQEDGQWIVRGAFGEDQSIAIRFCGVAVALSKVYKDAFQREAISEPASIEVEPSVLRRQFIHVCYGAIALSAIRVVYPIVQLQWQSSKSNTEAILLSLMFVAIFLAGVIGCYAARRKVTLSILVGLGVMFFLENMASAIIAKEVIGMKHQGVLQGLRFASFIQMMLCVSFAQQISMVDCITQIKQDSP